MNLSYDYEAAAGEMGAGSTSGNAGQLMSVTGTIDSQPESAVYTYDNLGRLVTSSQTTNTVSAERRYEYDRWGNRTGMWDQTTGGSQIQSLSLEQSAGAPTNRITNLSNPSGTSAYSYDEAGNVTGDGLHSYTYDAENRLVSVDFGATALYSYDQANRRPEILQPEYCHHFSFEARISIRFLIWADCNIFRGQLRIAWHL